MREDWLIWTVVTVQLLSGSLFVMNLVFSVLGIAPVSWFLYETAELAAATGLFLGTMLGAVVLRRSHLRRREAEAKVKAAQGAFSDLLEERFREWALTPTEREIALFAIKGLSTGEIAGLRQKSEGTVKAQTAAIYRKAGVKSRPELLSLFIDDLMSGDIARAAEAKRAA